MSGIINKLLDEKRSSKLIINIEHTEEGMSIYNDPIAVTGEELLAITAYLVESISHYSEMSTENVLRYIYMKVKMQEEGDIEDDEDE